MKLRAAADQAMGYNITRNIHQLQKKGEERRVFKVTSVLVLRSWNSYLSLMVKLIVWNTRYGNPLKTK